MEREYSNTIKNKEDKEIAYIEGYIDGIKQSIELLQEKYYS